MRTPGRLAGRRVAQQVPPPLGADEGPPRPVDVVPVQGHAGLQGEDQRRGEAVLDPSLAQHQPGLLGQGLALTPVTPG